MTSLYVEDSETSVWLGDYSLLRCYRYGESYTRSYKDQVSVITNTKFWSFADVVSLSVSESKLV